MSDRKFTPELFYEHIKHKLPNHDKQAMISVIKSFCGDSFTKKDIANIALRFISGL